MADFEFIQLLEDTGTWADFEADWRAQCESFGEDFDGYAEATFSVVRDIIVKEHRKAGVYALKQIGEGDKHLAMVQLNRTQLPGYTGNVLRARFLTVCPYLDFGGAPPQIYGMTIGSVLFHTIRASREELPSEHIKFHLRSPSDQTLFATIGVGLSGLNVFQSVEAKGAWLYITH